MLLIFHEIKGFAMQKTDLMFYSFLQFKYVRAAMHESLVRASGTLIAGLEQKSKLIDLSPHLLKIFFFSE